MPAVVSDTSVINYLAAVGHAELLRVQFGKIYVPPAVWRELHDAANLPGTQRRTWRKNPAGSSFKSRSRAKS